eukprot:1765353-Alexandrium_andersonii.AAC.1
MTAPQGRRGPNCPHPCLPTRPGGVGSVEPEPDALRVLPPRADIGIGDDVPTAGAARLAQLVGVLGVRGERLILGFPAGKRPRLEGVPAPEPDQEAGPARKLLPGPRSRGH